MAIALLPLKEGETLDSNIGRYAEMMGLKSTLSLRKLLFGCDSYPGQRLPGSINYLAEQTRDYWNMKPEDIIYGHTEYRYLTMMAPQSMREKILKMTLGSAEINSRPVWIARLRGERASKLRYCEECLKECIESHQTPYWKVDHQLAGVYCCDKHARVLKSVKGKTSVRYADQTVMRLIDHSDEEVLHSVSPLEKRAIESVSRKSVRQRADGNFGKSAKQYGNMLRDLGFLFENSRLKYAKIYSAWVDYFGREYCYLTNTNASKVSAWIDHLLRGTWGCDFVHPFIIIAGESLLEHLAALPGSYVPQNFKDRRLASEKEISMSVKAAYSCNGALHRNSDTFEFLSTRTGRWKLVCTCGLSYRLLKPAQGNAEILTPFSYGDRYKKRLAALIGKGMNISAAARELQTNPKHAYVWAAREGIINIKKLPVREVNRLRARWRLVVRNTVSKKRITSAMEADPTTYTKLSKFDPNWLRTFNRAHRSPAREKTLFGPNEPTADDIREAHRELISAEPPIRATRLAIVERTGFPRASDHRRPYWRFLAEFVEGRPAYLERVICWLATLASEQRLGDCDEALRSAGLTRSSFSLEQRSQIREIVAMNPANVRCSQRR
ncbi:Tn7-like transposition protein D [Burkholderia sp. OK233]|nr:Tn7-like transposition protein D [Burkholderia sp. OK233]